MTVLELRREVAKHNIRGRSYMNKWSLVGALEDALHDMKHDLAQ